MHIHIVVAFLTFLVALIVVTLVSLGLNKLSGTLRNIFLHLVFALIFLNIYILYSLLLEIFELYNLWTETFKFIFILISLIFMLVLGYKINKIGKELGFKGVVKKFKK